MLWSTDVIFIFFNDPRCINLTCFFSIPIASSGAIDGISADALFGSILVGSVFNSVISESNAYINAVENLVNDLTYADFDKPWVVVFLEYWPMLTPSLSLVVRRSYNHHERNNIQPRAQQYTTNSTKKKQAYSSNKKNNFQRHP